MYSMLSCNLPFLMQSIGFKGILLYGDDKQKTKYLPQVQHTVCTCIHYIHTYVCTLVHLVHVYTVFLLAIPTVHQCLHTYCTYCMIHYPILLLTIHLCVHSVWYNTQYYCLLYIHTSMYMHSTYLGHNTHNTITYALLL